MVGSGCCISTLEMSKNACERTLQQDKETVLNGGVVTATEQDAEE